MGARFEIGHANFVGYLTADRKALAPRADEHALADFLESLCERGTLISATEDTPDDWIAKIAYAAQRERKELPRSINKRDNRVLTSSEVSQRLDPLRTYFNGYDFYAMVLPSGSRQQDKASDQFFKKIAIGSRSRALILMPEWQHSDHLLQVVDPFPALRILAESPITPPAVVFWTSLGSSCVLPLAEAEHFFTYELRSPASAGLDTVHQLIVDRFIRNAASGKRGKRILHLSDLHFGTPEAARRRAWLKEQLARELSTVDRVVVTGDLFDNPEEPLRESFEEFRTDVENLTTKDLLVIPGNHDVRTHGTSFGPLGQNAKYVTDLRWDPVVVDEDLQAVFFSFNSCETEDFARGSVGDRQRLERSQLFDRNVRRRPELADFARIALVHHHPYAYDTAPSALYERIIARLFGNEERFVAFVDAEAFVKWCASRGVSLILHGHKHVPHLVSATVSVRGRRHEITVVGCGSTTGVGGRPMCYDIITMDPTTKRWNVLFYHDEEGDGSGFALQNVAIDLRS